jgi:hypothetical protein
VCIAASACHGSDSAGRLPTASPAPEFSGEQILRRSDEAMARLTSVRMTYREDPSSPGSDYTETLLNCPPDNVGYFAPFYPRINGGLRDDPPVFGESAAMNIALARSEVVGGQQIWVIQYNFIAPSIEGPFDVFRTEWIATDSYLLLKQESRDNSPFGAMARVTREYAEYTEVPIDCSG